MLGVSLLSGHMKCNPRPNCVDFNLWALPNTDEPDIRKTLKQNGPPKACSHCEHAGPCAQPPRPNEAVIAENKVSMLAARPDSALEH